jgi:hypothetical protein
MRIMLTRDKLKPFERHGGNVSEKWRVVKGNLCFEFELFGPGVQEHRWEESKEPQ